MSKKEKQIDPKEKELVQKAHDEVARACELIEECIKINGISTQGLISSCASIMTTILSEYKSPQPFYQIMTMMDLAFRTKRTEDGKEL